MIEGLFKKFSQQNVQLTNEKRSSPFQAHFPLSRPELGSVLSFAATPANVRVSLVDSLLDAS